MRFNKIKKMLIHTLCLSRLYLTTMDPYQAPTMVATIPANPTTLPSTEAILSLVPSP